MPELAEVETFANAIKEKCVGLTIQTIQFHRADLRYPFETIKLNKIFATGAQFTQAFREGKQLVIETDRGAVNISLGMSGAFKAITSEIKEKHQHVTIFFTDGSGLAYVDPRRFGFWKVRDKNAETYKICDPLSTQALRELFSQKAITQRNRSIKELLMDQKAIGGLGNIYALEALFLAGISPLRLCSDIAKKEWQKLAENIPIILYKAIEFGGSSIASYRSFNGNKGNFQELHQVYGRTAEKCLRVNCKGIIQRVVQNGRGSWFCPTCQK